jgi:CheY-like chemotaxis protein/anti-sigma regulatory factor (Ser/Thr protein kinase)
VSRIETGRFAFRQERFDLVTQAGVVAGVYLVRARDKGLRFSLINELERPTWVMGDAARFRQVLHNLLGNAIKFTQEGSVEMTLQHGSTPHEIRVQITDTGPGMTAQALSHIFEPFYQADPGGEALTSGAGLGLTIAHELARAMRGDITVSSEPGKGSTFVFTAFLPAAPEPQATGDVPAIAARASLAACNVLVAEDDDVNALIISAYLEQLGVVCERVCNGEEAVARALREVERPDLILMDCRMPVMDGIAATRAIRAQERTLALARVPVIALTAASAPEDRLQCTVAGMDDFIAKPFTKAELTRVLAQWGGAVEDGHVDAAAAARLA